jgi:lipid II:glycine glycyltransferase (peptidoglycan interpeptide bridge formation enzyme)
MRFDLQTTPDEWDQFVALHPDGHVLQCSAWAELKSAFGWRAERIAVRDGGRLVAGAQVLYRRLPLGTHIAYLPKGPLVDLGDSAICQVLLDAVHRQCRSRRAIMLKIEPDLRIDLNSYGSWERVRELLGGYGFQPGRQTIQPRRTILVDLTSDEDEILRRMKSKTRYNIRVAERKGVSIHHDEEEDIDDFVRLMAVTGERNAFGVHTAAYYRRAYALLNPAGIARLFIATYEGQPIAGLMVFVCNQKAWYMYGGSANEHRERMPNYALQWAAIRWAKACGCCSYDLYGVPDEEQETLEAQFADRREGLWGVYRFKRGFGGQLVRYVGAFDHVYDKPLYWLYHQALRMR